MREFRKTTGRGKKPQVWCIGLHKDDPTTYVVRWGVLNGAMQETADTPGTCGVVGHSDYQTSEQYVKFCIDREIRIKDEQGYAEYIDGKSVKKVISSVDVSKPLPKNFCFYKPKTSILDKKLSMLQSKNRAIWTLKRDGMMHIAFKRNNVWELYSRRMDLVTDKYPHIVSALEKMDLFDGTILIGEFVLTKDDGRDNFKGVSSICRAKEDLSLAYQGLGDFPKGKKDKKVLGKIGYYVFDVPFLNGVDMIATKVSSRLALIREMFLCFDPKLSVNTGLAASKKQMLAESKRRESMLRQHHIAPLKIFHTSADNDIELAKKLKAEGFVVLDADAIYGDMGYSFDGKARRPAGIYKRKPKFEDEFIISDIYEGSGRNRGRFGGFFIQQIHPLTNKIIDCGKCGGGFTDIHRNSFLDKRLIGKTIKVEFDSRQEPKNGEFAVRFPVFKGWADKQPDECIAQFLEKEWL